MTITPLASNAEPVQHIDNPGFQRRNIGPYIRIARAQIQHDIGHTLAGAVKGPLPAAATAMHIDAADIHQICILCRCAAGQHRRMFQQPDFLCRAIMAHGGNMLFHGGDKRGIGLQPVKPAKDR